MHLEGRCLSYGSSIPYHPIIDIVWNNCGIAQTDSPEAILEKVRTALQEIAMDAEESAPYLLPLMGVKQGTESISIWTPEAVRTRTFDTLWQMSLSSAQRKPLIVEIEEYHWIDKTSEDDLASLVESLPGGSILLLTTYRSGYRPPWLKKSYATQIPLHSLLQQDAVTIVESATQGQTLSDHLTQTIIEKSEGNPLFLEELTRAVIEHGDHGRWEEGIAECQRALAGSPDAFETAITLGFLGYAYLEKGDLNEAVVSLLIRNKSS